MTASSRLNAAEYGLLRSAVSPGRTLVFIDDSGTPEKPLRFWAADYHILSAVVMTSESYTAMETELSETLRELGVREFHAKELIRPRADSDWNHVGLERRLGVARHLFQVLRDGVSEIAVMAVSGEQFDAELKSRLPDTLRHMDVKTALSRAFYGSLLKRLKRKHSDYALIADHDKSTTQGLGFLGPVPEAFEGAVIQVDSHDLIGVQLADFAAYAYNRRPHCASRISGGLGHEMDKVFLEGWLAIKHRYVELLDEE